MKVGCLCTQCGRRFTKERGQLNRALKESPGKLYCSMACSGKARRKPKLPIAERRAKKAAYDLIRRHGPQRDEILAEKREYYRRTRDPEKQRRVRKARAAYHAAYCRKYYADPKRKAAKVRYDQRRRDSRLGEWGACSRLLIKLENTVRKLQPDRYERAKARGYYAISRGSQKRKRDAQISRW